MPTFKENPGGMKPSGYKMKYQRSHSAFPFKSPLKADSKESPPPKNIELVTDYKSEGLKDPDEGFAWYRDIDTGKISQMSK